METKLPGLIKKTKPKPVTSIIPIDQAGKQILVIDGANLDDNERGGLMAHIQAWMNSDEPVTILMIPRGTSVKLVKVESKRRKNANKGSD